MVTLELDPNLDSLLRQSAASIEMTPSQLATILLESSLVMSLGR